MPSSVCEGTKRIWTTGEFDLETVDLLRSSTYAARGTRMSGRTMSECHVAAMVRRATRSRMEGEEKMFVPPELPLPLDEFVDAMMQEGARIIEAVADLRGSAVRPPSAKERQRDRRELKRRARTLRVCLVGLLGLEGALPLNAARYVLLEEQLHQQLEAMRLPVRKGEDAVTATLRLLDELVAPPAVLAAHPAHTTSRAAMERLALTTFESPASESLAQVRASWFKSRQFRKVASLAREFDRRARHWRMVRPERLTPRAVDQIADEYAFSAKAFAAALPYVAARAEARTGAARFDWWMQARLPQVLEHTARVPELCALPGLLDPAIRNALGHGVPDIRMATREVVFHDMKRSVRLTLDQFFDSTRALTATMLPVFIFDGIERAVHFRSEAERIIGLVESERDALAAADEEGR